MNPGHRSYRIAILGLASFMIFGSYFAYDSVAAIAPSLIDALHTDRAAIGTMYSAYSFAAIAAVLLGGCGGAPPPSAHMVRYAVDWDRAGVTPLADGAGWEVTNDLGYRVRVTRGYITTYSMELVECPKAAATSPLDHVATLLGRLIEATASAGHSSGTPNPAEYT